MFTDDSFAGGIKILEIKPFAVILTGEHSAKTISQVEACASANGAQFHNFAAQSEAESSPVPQVVAV